MKPGDKVFTNTGNRFIGVIKTIHDKVVIFETEYGETRIFNSDYHYIGAEEEKKYIPWWSKLFNKVFRNNR